MLQRSRGIDVQPLDAVDPHVFDQRNQGCAFLSQRVGHPGWHLGESLALDDADMLRNWFALMSHQKCHKTKPLNMSHQN